MDYKSFFTLDNKSGIKTKESYIVSKYPDIHKKIKEFISEHNLNGLTFREEIYYFINNKTNKHICLNCSSDVKLKNTINKGYSDYCSLKCANDSGDLKIRQKDSIIKKYGVDSTNKLESVKDKKKISFIEKYGVDNPMKNGDIQLKQKESLNKNHGVYNPMKSDDIKLKLIGSINTKYGVNNVFESSIIKDKIKETNLELYGVSYPTQSTKVKEKIKRITTDKLLNKFPFIKKVNDGILECYCDKCNNNYTITRVLLNERNREGFGLCTVCNEVGINNVSELEKDIFRYVKTMVDSIKENDRSLLKNQELDILLFDKKIAIEVDGLYWHSELYKDKNYHLNKTIECEKIGFKLIHIFEDEWIYKQDIVKSRLRNILGLSENRIFARKCEIREVSIKNSKEFLNINHIQGECKSKIKLGLYYNDELVSLMTFGSGRVIMSGKPGEWELVRFCNKLNTNVIGGAGKLLKYFIKTYQPKEIISYADKRWSQGNMYEKLGFEFIHDSKPNYWYINGGIREYRFKYRKNKLINFPKYSNNLSEHEIMLLNKRYRIYDCGSKKYKMSL